MRRIVDMVMDFMYVLRNLFFCYLYGY